MKFEVTEADCFALCRQAPEFLPVVEQVGLLEGFECIGDLFYALVQSIISQQLAVKAAAAIFQRVEIHLGKITAESLLSAAFDDLRVGIQLWLGDEEFPSRLKIMWDSNALQYLRYETMYFAKAVLLRLLREHMAGD